MEKPIVRALDCLEWCDLEAAEEVVREDDYIYSKHFDHEESASS